MATWTTISASGSFMRATNETLYNTVIRCDITSASDAVVMDTTDDLESTLVLNGVGIVSDSVIVSVDSDTQITIDNNATETLTNTDIVFNIYTDTNISNEYKTVAKSIMLIDIKQSISNNFDVDDLIDSISDENEDYLNQTLAYLQLVMKYTSLGTPVDSENEQRMIQYQKLYDSAKTGFSNLKSDNVPTMSSGRFKI